ncbi:MAG: chromosomal replication initiator protein DnaA [Nitrospirae bacterium]|nr:chromosomal replication initiator protein DnaA [Nitrospirota bacterium]
MDLDDIWGKAIDAIQEKIDNQTFELWFKPLKLIQLQDQQLTIETPNRFFKEWIEDHYIGLINEVIEKIIKRQVSIKFKISDKQQDATLRKVEAKLENRKARLASKGIFLNPKYTFDSFVEGHCNQFARAAAMAVANSPGKSYNPLFIYGGVGLGKTHLMNAIGNLVIDLVIDKVPGIKLLYASVEQFLNEFVYSMRNDKMNEFKGKYRDLDVLLIDDIQFIAGKTGTQDELFHTFNALYDSHKQIVFSSDRPPKDISPITERLRSRFGMGLIADIQAPDVETKVAILGKKSEMEGIKLPEDVIYLLADKVKSNIRELESCMIRLGAYSSISGSPITTEMAKEVLNDMMYEEKKALTVEFVQKTVCEYYGLKPHDIKARKRSRDIVFPRQVAMYLCKALTDTSLSEIGKGFGGKDHSTVIHACKQVEKRRSTDGDFSRKLDYLINKIKD